MRATPPKTTALWLLCAVALVTTALGCACPDGYVEVDGKCDQCNPPSACEGCVCTSHYEGTRCGSCKAEEAWRWDGECKECNTAIIGLALLSMGTWVALSILSLLFSIQVKLIERYSVLFYCSIKALQITAFIAQADINWPFNLEWVLRSTVVTMFVFDPEALPLECNVGVGIIWRWLCMMLSPFVTALVYGAIFLISVPFLKHRVKQLGFLTIRAFFLLLLILWAGLVSASAMPFDCTILDGSGDWAMDSDFSITCWESPEWWGMSVPGFFFFLAFTIGLPTIILMVGFVGCVRYEFRDVDNPGSFDEYWGLTAGFFYRDFGRFGTIWEAFDMFCRAHVILIERFATDWPYIHLSVSVVFLTILVVVKTIVRPYKRLWLEVVTTLMYVINILFALMALLAHTLDKLGQTTAGNVFMLTLTIILVCSMCVLIAICSVVGPLLEATVDKAKATFKAARREYNDIKVQKEYNNKKETFLQVLIRKYTGKEVTMAVEGDEEVISEDKAIRISSTARSIYEEGELRVLTNKYGGWILKLLNNQYTAFLNEFHDNQDKMDGEVPFRAVYELEKNIFKYVDRSVRVGWRMSLSGTVTLSACESLEAAIKICDRAAEVYKMWRIDVQPPLWADIIQMDLNAAVNQGDKVKNISLEGGAKKGGDIAALKLAKAKKLENKKQQKLLEFFKDADEKETKFDPWIYYFLHDRYPQMPHTALWLINIWEGTIIESVESGLYKNKWRLLLREFLPEVRHLVRATTNSELETADREMFTILIRHLAPIISTDPADIPAARDAQQVAIKEFQEKRKTVTASQLGLSDDARNVFLEEGRHWPDGTLEALFTDWNFLVTEFHNKPVRAFKVLDQWRTTFFAHLRKTDVDDWKRKVQRAMVMTPPGSQTLPVIEQYLQAYRGSTEMTNEQITSWLREQSQNWSRELLAMLETDYRFLIPQFAGQARLALSIMHYWEQNLFKMMEPEHQKQWRGALEKQIVDLPLGKRLDDFVASQREQYIAKYGTLEQRQAAKRMGGSAKADTAKAADGPQGNELVVAGKKGRGRRRSSILGMFGGRRGSVDKEERKDEPAPFSDDPDQMDDEDVELGKVKTELSTKEKLARAESADEIPVTNTNEDLEKAKKVKVTEPRVDKAEMQRSQDLYTEESTHWDAEIVKALMEKYRILVRLNPFDPKRSLSAVEMWERGLFRAVSPLEQGRIRTEIMPLIAVNHDPDGELPKVVLRQLKYYNEKKQEKRLQNVSLLRAAY